MATLNLLECHLSYNDLNDSPIVATIRFQGFINGIMIQILLYSGSFDNFL